MFLGAQSKGVHVDTSIGGTGVVLEGLNSVEVRTLTLGEAVLAVELQLGSDNGVLTPAVHVEGSLRKHEGASISEGGTSGSETSGSVVGGNDTTKVEETRGINDTIGTRNSAIRAEGHHSVGEGINGISVVEGLGTKSLEQSGGVDQGRAVVNVGIGLNDPDELLARVVEVQLDLVGGRTDRLVTSELDLLNEVLVGVLGHLAALIGIEEDVINIQRGSNKGLLVGLGHRHGGNSSGQGVHGPQALTNGAEINVDLHLVVLKGNQGKGKSGVAAKPELQRHVKGGLGQGVAGSTHLVGGRGGGARTRHSSEGGVGDVGKLGGVTNHLEVARLLLLGEGQLVPDVHPVTILTVNALTTNLNLNLGNQLLTNEI